MSKRVSRVCKWCGHKVTFDVEKHDRHIYNKAIDDFANLMKEAMEHDWSTTKICDQIIYNNLYDKCNEIAEQLKAGVKYEM